VVEQSIRILCQHSAELVAMVISVIDIACGRAQHESHICDPVSAGESDSRYLGSRITHALQPGWEAMFLGPIGADTEAAHAKPSRPDPLWGSALQGPRVTLRGQSLP
jgi:hypothetical protein